MDRRRIIVFGKESYTPSWQMGNWVAVFFFFACTCAITCVLFTL